jgi:hypothetical protein
MLLILLPFLLKFTPFLASIEIPSHSLFLYENFIYKPKFDRKIRPILYISYTKGLKLTQIRKIRNSFEKKAYPFEMKTLEKKKLHEKEYSLDSKF